MANTWETTTARSDPAPGPPKSITTPARQPRNQDTLRREHRDGPLNAALKNIIKTGNLLALHGNAFGVDLRWRGEQAAWRTQSTRILRENFEHETATEFLHATQAKLAPGTTYPTDTSQIRAIRDGTDLLVALRSTLSGQGSER